MSDEGWAFHQRFTLAVRVPNGGKPENHRFVMDRIFRIARIGSPWRDQTEGFGKGSSICRPFRRWALAGLWETIIEALNDGPVVPDALQMYALEPASDAGSTNPARVLAEIGFGGGERRSRLRFWGAAPT